MSTAQTLVLALGAEEVGVLDFVSFFLVDSFLSAVFSVKVLDGFSFCVAIVSFPVFSGVSTTCSAASLSVLLDVIISTFPFNDWLTLTVDATVTTTPITKKTKSLK